MAKSKVRGGAKAHRAKIAARNQKLKSAQSAMEKLFNEAMKKEIEAIKAKKEEEENPSENTEQ